MSGVHENTVRFYEKIGFLTPPARRENGYRIYTSLQLDECRLIRVAMRAEVIQNGLRKKAVEIVRLVAALRCREAYGASLDYIAMIENEIRAARDAISTVETLLARGRTSLGSLTALTRREAAGALRVTSETLRTWERNGLLRVSRKQNGYRFYDACDMERLNVIRTLRCANYSLSSILRLLCSLDSHSALSVEHALNTPAEDEEIISVCDRLIFSLNETLSDARLLSEMISEIKRKY